MCHQKTPFSFSFVSLFSKKGRHTLKYLADGLKEFSVVSNGFSFVGCHTHLSSNTPREAMLLEIINKVNDVVRLVLYLVKRTHSGPLANGNIRGFFALIFINLKA